MSPGNSSNDSVYDKAYGSGDIPRKYGQTYETYMVLTYLHQLDPEIPIDNMMNIITLAGIEYHQTSWCETGH